MDKLLYKINVLKNRHPFISFVILNQMNGNYLNRTDQSINHFPRETDIYGTEQLFKICDVVYFKIMPWKLGIKNKFLHFLTDAFPDFEEYKVSSTTKYTGFEPVGNVFRIVSKQRLSEDLLEDNLIDIEKVFEKRISGDDLDIDIPNLDLPTSNLEDSGDDIPF